MNRRNYNDNNLGISIEYKESNNLNIETMDNKIIFKQSIESPNWVIKNTEDVIEIYNKNNNISLEESIKKLIINNKQSIDENNCEIITYKRGKNIFLVISYKKEITIDVEKCFSDSQNPDCIDNLIKNSNKKIKKVCSNFEKWPYNNYFLYQPENIKNKFIFIRHIEGFENSVLNIDSIQLSN